MTTLDEAWTKAAAEEVLGEENATNENVDAFYESDRSLILDKASRGRSLLAAPRDLAVVVDAAASPAIVPSQPAAPLAPLAPPASTPAAMDTRRRPGGRLVRRLLRVLMSRSLLIFFLVGDGVLVLPSTARRSLLLRC